ncbi:MAG: tetratricopeptide repeat protein [Deferrisomatales bacterium]|nr:tetratricopeptide repeat protein [Deferrisomatales bacterium]
MKDPPTRYRPLLAALLVVVVGALAYSNTFHVPFVFDDEPSITENPLVWGVERFLGTREGYDYNPRRFVGYLTFALNYDLGGFDVRGYHAVNLAIHLVSALLVYALLRLIFRTPYFRGQGSGAGGQKVQFESQTSNLDSNLASLASWRFEPRTVVPLFAALLFVAHPVQTQAVTYVVQRLTSLCTLFYLLSVVLYVQARLRGGGALPGDACVAPMGRPWLWLAGSVLSAVLAMTTKEIAFTLPLAVMLYEVFFFRGPWKLRLLWLLPILATLPVVPLSVLTAGESAGEILSDVSEAARVQTDIPRSHYLFTQFRVIVTYLRLLFLPINQNLDYDYPIYTTFLTPPVFLSFLLLAALLLLALFLWWRSRPASPRPLTPDNRLIAFGLLWFFLTLSVESSVIPIVDPIFEHRLYLPSFGAFAAMSTALALLVAKLDRPSLCRGLTALAAVAVLALGVATWQRNRLWQDPVALWQDTAAKAPGNARAHINLGAVLGEAGRMEEAIDALSEAVRLAPEHVESYANLGAALASVGRLQEAIPALFRAVAIEPDNPDALNNLGTALTNVGRLDEAAAALSEAIRLGPEQARAWYNLGRLHVLAGRSAEAVAALERAVALKPDYDNALVELAEALNHVGRFREAAAALAPHLPRLAHRSDARLAFGVAAHCVGDRTGATRELGALRQLDPRQADRLASFLSRPCDEP